MKWSPKENEAYLVLCGRRVSCDGLARVLRVSRPTAARAVASLRKKGVDIVSVRDNGSWHYVVRNQEHLAARQWRRLMKFVGSIRRCKPEVMSLEDREIYGL